MKIVNVMISKVMGGIEQAFLDYNKAFQFLNYDVLSIINKTNVVADKVHTPFLSIKFNKWNPLLIPKLYVRLKKFAPDVIIVHQKKAIPLFRIVAKMLKVKLIGVAHNPAIKRLEKCDAIFSVALNQKYEIIKRGIKQIPIHVVPNMIETPKKEPQYQPFHTPVVIGTFGRFDPMKGFCNLIEALGILKQKNIPFKAIIGGCNNGSYAEEERRIIQKVTDLDLKQEINFCGWVSDKEKFFNQIDIFVLPSLLEPFGIVLLEAALAKKTIICSDAAGPKEIFEKTDAAKIFEKQNIEMLADYLTEISNNPKKAENMAQKAYIHVKENYSIELVARILKEALEKVIK